MALKKRAHSLPLNDEPVFIQNSGRRTQQGVRINFPQHLLTDSLPRSSNPDLFFFKIYRSEKFHLEKSKSRDLFSNLREIN